MKVNSSQKNIVFLTLLVTIVFFILLPTLAKSEYYLNVFINIFIGCICALCVRILFNVGKISLVQGSFVAIGAYISSLLVTELGLSFWLALPLAGMLTAIIGALIGYPALRLKGTYFVLLSFALAEAIRILLLNWRSLTGGASGITSIPPPNTIKLFDLPPIIFSSKLPYYYLALFLLIITLTVIYIIDYSRLGRIISAIRQNNDLAESLGINIGFFNTLAFTVACFFCGLCGSFNAHHICSVYPTSYTLWNGVDYLIYTIIGGTSNLFGPLIGTLVMRLILIGLAVFNQYKLIVYGVVLIIVIMFLPNGLISIPRLKPIQFLINKLRTFITLKIDVDSQKANVNE